MGKWALDKRYEWQLAEGTHSPSLTIIAAFTMGSFMHMVTRYSPMGTMGLDMSRMVGDSMN